MAGSSNSNLRVFIIEDQADYRALLSHHVSSHWIDAVVKTYDPVSSGRLPEHFSGAGNDIVLLGHPAGGGDALDWLRQFCKVSGFPPVIFVGNGYERQIIDAIRIGATDYISKKRLNHRRLIKMIQAALGTVDEGKLVSESEKFFADSEELASSGLPSLKGYVFKRRLVVNDLSAVYLVSEEASGRLMVLKVMRQVPDSGAEVVFDRFLQEYELVAKLDHPNIVKIFDLGVADDHAYIAMEYCDQGSLKQRIVGGLKPDRAFRLMRWIAGALGELHTTGIMHRDLKPTNVMFRDDGTLVLIDFGLAKEAELRAEITGAGEIFGTPYYMSPEQGHGNEVDARGDIYSLGVIFFEMLTGKKPYDGDSAMAVIIQHRQAPIPRLPVGSVAVSTVHRQDDGQGSPRIVSNPWLNYSTWTPADCDVDVA